MIIYQLTNKLNGKSYIGQTVHTLHQRLKGHARHKRRSIIGNAIKKYGIQCFDSKILVYANSLEELNYYEEALIAKLHTQRPSGYNIKLGGGNHRGMTHTPEAIEKIRAASTGRQHSDEAKAKISATRIMKQIRHTPEVLARISEKRKGQMSGEAHPMFGKTHSEEAKRKISELSKGRHHTEEAKQKISEASKNMWETRERTVPYKPRPSTQGRTPWNKGKTGFTHTDEVKQQISEASKLSWNIRRQEQITT